MSELTKDQEREFLSSSRETVLRYLSHQDVMHGGVPQEPEWALPPYVSIWAIRSPKKPGGIGWYAITGDLPTDYVSSASAGDARSAMRHFARLWAEVAECMKQGVQHPDCRIGTPQTWPELHVLLSRRVGLLNDFARDDSHWVEPAPTFAQ